MALIITLKGVLIGLVIAAPVGPVGLLCVQRTLRLGRLAGIFSGLGAAVADTFFGSIAAFGLHAVADFLVGHRDVIEPVGSVLVCAFGVKILFGKIEITAETPSGGGLLGMFFGTLFLTLANPITILAFMAIFVGFGVSLSGLELIQATLLVGGVFAGSLSWWLILVALAGYLREKIEIQWIRPIQWGSGLIILVMGVVGLFVGWS